MFALSLLEDFLNSLEIPKNLKIAIMLNASDLIHNNKFNFDNLYKLIPVKAKDSKVNLIRVACHTEYINHIIPLFDFLDNYGYLSAYNIAQVSENSREDLEKIASTLASSKVNIIYFADSLGSLSAISNKRSGTNP